MRQQLAGGTAQGGTISFSLFSNFQIFTAAQGHCRRFA